MYEFHFVRGDTLIYSTNLEFEKKKRFKRELLKGLANLNLKRDYTANCEAYSNDEIYLSFRKVGQIRNAR